MTKQEIGAIIRQEREAQKKSHNAVAVQMIINKGKTRRGVQVDVIEQGIAGYTIDLLIDVCDALGLEITVTKRATKER